MLAIAPGGVYEAQFGDSYYQILWRKRMGFAKVALEAKVVSLRQRVCIKFLSFNLSKFQPIVPIFTQNLREAFRTVSLGKRLWLKMYQWCKLPIVPIYGGFPVKLRTFVGQPIPYDQSLTVEELQVKVIILYPQFSREFSRKEQIY